eukprot:6468241-Amphidinium_carterae.2
MQRAMGWFFAPLSSLLCKDEVQWLAASPAAYQAALTRTSSKEYPNHHEKSRGQLAVDIFVASSALSKNTASIGISGGCSVALRVHISLLKWIPCAQNNDVNMIIREVYRSPITKISSNMTQYK